MNGTGNLGFEDSIKIYEVKKIQEYRKWCQEIPFIQFPLDWQIQIIPPAGGAIVRFKIKRNLSPNEVSVYLDCYDRLRLFGQPYWEICPYQGETYRCEMNNDEELLNAIEVALGNKRYFLTKT